MGIIKMAVDAVTGTVSRGLRDTLSLEVFEPDMGDQTVFARGVKTREGSVTGGTDDIVSNGSVIHVYPDQFMMLVDGGKIVDFTSEPGYYEVNNSASPSFMNKEFKGTLKEAVNRLRFGGQTPMKQKVYYINMQPIKGIKFGTRNPINYYDSFYNAELFLRAHGTYSITIEEPILFYENVIPKNKDRVEINDINEQYLDEFLEAFQSAINQMSADGTRISFVTSKGRELSKYMRDILDEDWRQMRGIEIESVGIASISYDDKSTELINMRNEGAMLSDPTIREGYMQGHVARGLEAAGSNANGAMAGFMGMGIGMQAGGSMMGAASQTNMQQMQMMQNQQAAQQQMQQAAAPVQQTAPAAGWTCECGATNTGKFCSECGKPQPAPAAGWTCECGATNTGKFCSECGKPAPAAEWTCECGNVNKGKFCSNCGKQRQ